MPQFGYGTKKKIKLIIDENFTLVDYLGELLIIVDLLKDMNPYEISLISKIIKNQ